MKNDANWCRAIGKTLLRMAEGRRHDNDLYAALRELAFMHQAVALVIDDDDEFRAEASTAPGNESPRKAANE